MTTSPNSPSTIDTDSLQEVLLRIQNIQLAVLFGSLAKETANSQTGNFKKEEAILALKEKLILKYWQIEGLNEYLDGISKRAFQDLCGDI